ncbi:hypothetical protein CHUAL_005445 [Chamberlinius hualienensis]
MYFTSCLYHSEASEADEQPLQKRSVLDFFKRWWTKNNGTAFKRIKKFFTTDIKKGLGILPGLLCTFKNWKESEGNFHVKLNLNSENYIPEIAAKLSCQDEMTGVSVDNDVIEQKLYQAALYRSQIPTMKMKSLLVILVLCLCSLDITTVYCERIQYHMQGHQGPYSYKFGFDTGPGQGYNRQFRHEEQDANGVIHGKYGYYDKNGKQVIVHYTADPHDGFKVLKDSRY